jgi:hypothetical protein
VFRGNSGRVKGGGYKTGKAVFAAHPVQLTSPLKMVFDVDRLLKHGVARFKQVPAYEPPLPLLPNFEALGESSAMDGRLDFEGPADIEGPANGTPRDFREDEVPEPVWEFVQWLKRYRAKHHGAEGAVHPWHSTTGC